MNHSRDPFRTNKTELDIRSIDWNAIANDEKKKNHFVCCSNDCVTPRRSIATEQNQAKNQLKRAASDSYDQTIYAKFKSTNRTQRISSEQRKMATKQMRKRRSNANI